MLEPGSSLDDQERSYLAAFARLSTPSPDRTQEALAKVQQRLAEGAVVDLEQADPPDEGDTRRRGIWLGVGVAVLAVAAAVVLALRLDVVSMLASESPDHAPAEAAYAEADSDGPHGRARVTRPHGSSRSGDAAGSAPSAQEPQPEPEPEPEPEPTLESESKPPTQARPRRTRPPNEEASDDAEPVEPEPADATLHAEMALLRPANAALRAGNHARALELLDAHARSFPRSALAEERSFARIRALCGLGRGEQAREEIAAFDRRYKGSPLSGRVAKACPASEDP